MITNKETLRRTLVEHGIKPTFQRLAILAAVQGNREHLPIRDFHARLVRDIPTLSKTTLYSSLELFARRGLVTRLLLDPSEVRYDGILPTHHHFVCSACGRILDLAIECVNGRRGEFHGHRIEEVHGYFKGTCRPCLSRKIVRPSARKVKKTIVRRKIHA